MGKCFQFRFDLAKEDGTKPHLTTGITEQEQVRFPFQNAKLRAKVDDNVCLVDELLNAPETV